jgi:hypothetical protein
MMTEVFDYKDQERIEHLYCNLRFQWCKHTKKLVLNLHQYHHSDWMGRYTSNIMWQWRVNYMETYFPSGNYVLIIFLIFLPLFRTHSFRFKVFILILFYSFYNSIVHNARCEYLDGIILQWCQAKTSKYLIDRDFKPQHKIILDSIMKKWWWLGSKDDCVIVVQPE